MTRLTILVTGSRAWTDRAAIRTALLHEYEHVAGYIGLGEVLVRHGAQGTYRNSKLIKGADMIANEEALSLGMRTHPCPADWHAPCQPECAPGHRRVNQSGIEYCPAAGAYRNQRMVNLRVDVCLAFPLGPSRGTRDCLRRAHTAGIPMVDYGQLLTPDPNHRGPR